MGWCGVWQELSPGDCEEEEGRGGKEGDKEDMGGVQRPRDFLHSRCKEQFTF